MSAEGVWVAVRDGPVNAEGMDGLGSILCRLMLTISLTGSRIIQGQTTAYICEGVFRMG